MDDENIESKINYYSVMPATVRYDKKISPSEKLLYSEITALANKEGYCYAQNRYFAKLYGVSTDTVSRWFSNLQKNGYVNIQVNRGKNNEVLSRYVYIVDTPSLQKYLYPSPQKCREGTGKNVEYNNININNNIHNKDEPKKEEPKIRYAECVFMTESDYKKLIDDFGEQKAKLLIDKMNYYKRTYSKKYDDDYSEIMLWETEAKLKQINTSKTSSYNSTNTNTNTNKTGIKLHDQREYPPGFLEKNIYANFRMINEGGGENNVF